MIDLTAMGSTNRDPASIAPGGFIKFSGNESTSKIEYDVKLLFTGSSDAMLTMSTESFQGCKVVIYNAGSAAITVASTFNGFTECRVAPNEIFNFTFMNGMWRYDKLIKSDFCEYKHHDVNLHNIGANEIIGNKVVGAVWN